MQWWLMAGSVEVEHLVGADPQDPEDVGIHAPERPGRAGCQDDIQRALRPEDTEGDLGAERPVGGRDRALSGGPRERLPSPDALVHEAQDVEGEPAGHGPRGSPDPARNVREARRGGSEPAQARPRLRVRNARNSLRAGAAPAV